MARSTRRFATTLLAGAVGAVIAACGGSDDIAPVNLGNAVALTASARLVSFDRAAPATLQSDVAITGLLAGEQLLGIDFRPADGKLYVLSNQARLYTVDPATGVATLKSTLVAAAGDPYAGLAGTRFGVDFNPVADRLRVVSDTGMNLRINVDTGATLTDGAINGAAAAITASAYTNSFAGTTTTQLYAIDAAAGTIYLQNPPNNGTLTMPLALGVTATAANGFDIDPRSNTAYAALTVGGMTRLYTVATTGAATAIGPIGSGAAVLGFALRPPAASAVVALTIDGKLASFDPAAPNTLSAAVAIAGLGVGEKVLGIDFRPANARLYAITSLGRILTVEPTTGASTLVSTLSADPTDATAPFSGLTAGLYSVDFNPVADRLRVISDSGANLRINVETGATTTDGTINRATPAMVVGGAYTNSFAGTTSTRLFDIDAALDVLSEQTPPNNGTLVDVAGAGLGLDVSGQGAIDIAGGDNGLVLAALRVGSTGPYSLYTVSLTTGAATLYRNTSGNAALSQIGGAAGPALTDIAIRY